MTRKLLFIAAALSIVACSKDDSTSPSTNSGNGGSINSTVPSTFTQKLLIKHSLDQVSHNVQMVLLS